MSDFIISDFEFNELRIDILSALAQIELGKVSEELLKLVLKRIDYLNGHIDLIEGSKSIEQYLIVDMCYQFYRIRDKIDLL